MVVYASLIITFMAYKVTDTELKLNGAMVVYASLIITFMAYKVTDTEIM